jgi:DNA-binding NarL/FixJ family response regulator
MGDTAEAVSLARKGAAVAIRVLVVDDHQLFAEAVSSLLTDAGIDVVGSLRTGSDAISFLEDHVADVVVLDIGLPAESGLEIGKRILDRWPGMKIIALSAVDDERAISEAIHIGFHALVTKDTPSHDLVRIVRAIARGEPGPLLPWGLHKRVGRTGPRDRLTGRERHVLSLLAEGLDSRTIADRLNMTRAEVRSEVQSLREKLEVHNRLEVVTKAISEPPDASTDHPHLTAMTDDQIFAHLRFMHARGIASLSPVDFDNMRALHAQLHRQVPPSPA